MNTESSTSIRPGAQPFFLSGGSIGLLCIHGLGGTGNDFRIFATIMQKTGWTVSVMRVAGHGVTPEVLRETSPADWRESVDRAVADLQTRVKTVFILGASFGGVLALDAARRHPDVCGMVLVNTPLSYRVGGGFQYLGLKFLQLLGKDFPKPGLTSDEKQHYAKTGSLVAWPVTAILDSRKFMSSVVRPTLAAMKTPALIIRNGDDPLVSAKNANEICTIYGGSTRQYILPQTTHRPFRDPAQCAAMAKEIQEFATHCLAHEFMIH